MSISVDNGQYNGGRVTIYVDTENEVTSLSTEYTPGSVAFVINASKIYMLNNNHEWKEI